MTIRELEQFSPNDWFYDVADQLKRHIYGRSAAAFAAGDAARDALTDRSQLEARQRAIREQILAGMGGLPPDDTPLEARTVGVVEGDGFRVEKVMFESQPGHIVTANLYLPEGLEGKCGAVQFVCGHHRQAKHEPEYQIVCQYLAQAGLIVLAQDPIGQGERMGYYEKGLGESTVAWGTNEHDYAGAQCWPLGDGIARYFLHDAMRGIDYLCSRPEVDPARIGVTGNSGGGVQCSLMMMADPRIAAAAPATFIMNRQTYQLAGGAQDAEQIWPGFTAAGFDHEDILLAMAPKPVRVLAVTGDFFPIEGTRRTVERCRRIREMCGCEDRLDLVEDVSGHAFTPRMARAAAEFFARHLLDRPEVRFDEARIRAFEPAQLWCTRSGQVRGDIPDAPSATDSIRGRAAGLARYRRDRREPDEREKRIGWLRERVTQHRRPCDLNPRFLFRRLCEELEVEACLWWSQEGLFNFGYLFRHYRNAGEELPVTLAVWDGGTHQLASHAEWLRAACESGRAVLVLDVSGVGALAPRSLTRQPDDVFYGTIHKFATDLFWLDDDLPALRTWDVVRALEMLAQWPGVSSDPIEVYAHGRHGLYGRLSALIDGRIQGIEVVNGMSGYDDWVGARHYDSRDIYSVALRGVLQHFDLPEVE